jgi:hypothetical protein
MESNCNSYTEKSINEVDDTNKPDDNSSVILGEKINKLKLDEMLESFKKKIYSTQMNDQSLDRMLASSAKILTIAECIDKASHAFFWAKPDDTNKPLLVAIERNVYLKILEMSKQI